MVQTASVFLTNKVLCDETLDGVPTLSFMSNLFVLINRPDDFIFDISCEEAATVNEMFVRSMILTSLIFGSNILSCLYKIHYSISMPETGKSDSLPV